MFITSEKKRLIKLRKKFVSDKVQNQENPSFLAGYLGG